MEAVDSTRGLVSRNAWLVDVIRERVTVSPTDELDVASHALVREQAALARDATEIVVEAGSMRKPPTRVEPRSPKPAPKVEETVARVEASTGARVAPARAFVKRPLDRPLVQKRS